MSKQEFTHATDAIDNLMTAVGTVVSNLAFDVEFEGKLDRQRANTVATLLALKELADKIINDLYADDIEEGRAKLAEAYRQSREDAKRERMLRVMLEL